MTDKEKAKAYDNALERARNIRFGNPQSATANTVCEEIFPELKESEDEKIRKILIEQMERWHECAIANNVIQDIKDSADAITWLERQGEHANFRNKIQIGDEVTRNENGILVNSSQLDRVVKERVKQGEQKSAWSEEDERIRYAICDTLDRIDEHIMEHNNQLTHRQVKDWLKTIKERMKGE